ncbi:MAG: cell division protein SepF [Clostridiales bacterium]|jgi:hypothetical protein|nr:cell division protein SepF [Clostridiales bacterium]
MNNRDDEFFRSGRNYRGKGNYEFFEDTHNARGEYTGGAGAGEGGGRPAYSLPDGPRGYGNVVIYKPQTPDDVQTLIDYLKRREPAIIHLDGVDELIAQRILDFVSGAIYALNGSVHRVNGNIFLLSPEGVEITIPYEPDRR